MLPSFLDTKETEKGRGKKMNKEQKKAEQKILTEKLIQALENADNLKWESWKTEEANKKYNNALNEIDNLRKAIWRLEDRF
jgi:hypothetical protein